MTIAVEAMTFIRAMRVGDVLEVYTEVESVGRTSMKIHIEAWAQRFQTHAATRSPTRPSRSSTSATTAARGRFPS